MWLGALVLLLGTVGVLLTARIALAVLMALGPVFVVLALFDGTRGLTAGWLRGVVLTAITPLFVVLGGMVTLELLVPIISALSTSAQLGEIRRARGYGLFPDCLGPCRADGDGVQGGGNDGHRAGRCSDWHAARRAPGRAATPRRWRRRQTPPPPCPRLLRISRCPALRRWRLPLPWRRSRWRAARLSPRRASVRAALPSSPRFQAAGLRRSRPTGCDQPRQRHRIALSQRIERSRQIAGKGDFTMKRGPIFAACAFAPSLAERCPQAPAAADARLLQHAYADNEVVRIPARRRAGDHPVRRGRGDRECRGGRFRQLADHAQQARRPAVRKAAGKQRAHQHDGGDQSPHLFLRSRRLVQGPSRSTCCASLTRMSPSRLLAASARHCRRRSRRWSKAIRCRSPQTPRRLNFAWKRSGDQKLWPARVYDDGAFTYLLWPDKSAVPAILVRNEKGEEGPVNYAVRDTTIVIDDVPGRTGPALRQGQRGAGTHRAVGAAAAFCRRHFSPRPRNRRCGPTASGKLVMAPSRNTLRTSRDTAGQTDPRDEDGAQVIDLATRNVLPAVTQRKRVTALGLAAGVLVVAALGGLTLWTPWLAAPSARRLRPPCSPSRWPKSCRLLPQARDHAASRRRRLRRAACPGAAARSGARTRCAARGQPLCRPTVVFDASAPRGAAVAGPAGGQRPSPAARPMTISPRGWAALARTAAAAQLVRSGHHGDTGHADPGRAGNRHRYRRARLCPRHRLHRRAQL